MNFKKEIVMNETELNGSGVNMSKASKEKWSDRQMLFDGAPLKRRPPPAVALSPEERKVAFVAWLNEQMDGQLAIVSSGEMTIGPDEAAAALEFRSNIRKESRGNIRKWARIMLEGGWRPIPEGPTFSTARKMIQGHHRMHALVLAGKSDPSVRVPFVFNFGYPPDSVVAMDQGQRRDDSQVARSMGIDVPQKVLSAVRWYLRIGEGLTGSNTKYSAQDLLDARDTIKDAIGELERFINQKHPSPMWGAALFAHQKNPQRITAFAEEMCRKGRADSGPVTCMLEWLDKTDSAGGQNQRNAAVHALYAMRAWVLNKPFKNFLIKDPSETDIVRRFFAGGDE